MEGHTDSRAEVHEDEPLGDVRKLARRKAVLPDI